MSNIVKQTKKFLNNLIHDSIHKIDGRSFDKIIKTVTNSRGDYLEQYKDQLPSILKSYSSKNKFSVNKLKEDFKAPETDYKQDYNVFGTINYQIKNISKKTGLAQLVDRERRFNFPMRGVTNKQLKNPAFLLLYAEQYACDNDPSADYVVGVVNGGVSSVSASRMSTSGMSSQGMRKEKYSIQALKCADGVNVTDGHCVIDFICMI